jgi:hypothetical protein
VVTIPFFALQRIYDGCRVHVLTPIARRLFPMRNGGDLDQTMVVGLLKTRLLYQ